MRLSLFLAATLLLLSVSHPTVASAAGQQDNGIHHCVDASGHAVFTDRSCADMQAVPAPASPDPSSSAPLVTFSSGDPRIPLEPPPVLCATSPDQLRQQLVDSFAARDANRLAGLMLWSGYSKRGVVSSIESLARLMKRPLLDVQSGGGDDSDAPPEQEDIYDASQPLDSVVSEPGLSPPSGADDRRKSPSRDDRRKSPSRDDRRKSLLRVDDRLTVETASDDDSGQPRQTHFAIARQSGCFWLRRLD